MADVLKGFQYQIVLNHPGLRGTIHNTFVDHDNDEKAVRNAVYQAYESNDFITQTASGAVANRLIDAGEGRGYFVRSKLPVE